MTYQNLFLRNESENNDDADDENNIDKNNILLHITILYTYLSP